jgi:(2Fe-2S) ferredoxin
VSKKKRRQRLREKFAGKLADGEHALVVCVGKNCCPRAESRALVEDARAYANGRVRVEVIGCLKVCKKGPIAATLPKGKLKKRVDRQAAHALIDKLIAQKEAARYPAANAPFTI